MTAAAPRGSILVVDDERSMRELLEILLAKEGHVVDVAQDAKSGLQAFEEHRHPLVITDVMLGRRSVTLGRRANSAPDGA